jgi:YesN/AraC family two-component response regulator
VTTAENGRQGSRLIVQRAFDLVLTDLLMPERDGLEFIGDVRKQQPGARIIAMSGGGQIAREPYLKMAKAFGAHALLEKPFSQEQLWAALASVQDSAPPTVGSTPHAPHPR